MLDPIELSKYFTLSQQRDVMDLDELCSMLPPSKRRNQRKKRSRPGHIPRPLNSFLIFRQEKQVIIRKFCPRANHREISKIVAKWWRELYPEEKKVFNDAASLIKAAHEQEYPDYVYRPVKKKHNNPEKATTTTNQQSSHSTPETPQLYQETYHPSENMIMVMNTPGFYYPMSPPYFDEQDAMACWNSIYNNLKIPVPMNNLQMMPPLVNDSFVPRPCYDQVIFESASILNHNCSLPTPPTQPLEPSTSSCDIQSPRLGYPPEPVYDTQPREPSTVIQDNQVLGSPRLGYPPEHVYETHPLEPSAIIEGLDIQQFELPPLPTIKEETQMVDFQADAVLPDFESQISNYWS